MSFAYYVKVFFVLGGFLLFFLLVLKYIKKFQRQHLTGDICIVDKKVLNNSVSMMIVKVRAQEFLVSVSSKDVSILSQLS